MDSFAGKLAVVTGGGSGMGRELVRQLAALGCSVAACDLNADTVGRTADVARVEAAGPGVQVSAHVCDVSDEARVLRFRDELLTGHATDHVDLVFSNAGIGGGESNIGGSREVWERVFAVDWWGVYYCARVFLPLLIASAEGVLVNTSSVNGLWATAHRRRWARTRRRCGCRRPRCRWCRCGAPVRAAASRWPRHPARRRCSGC